jgi:ABC-type transport system substrate-binding protein
VRRSDFLATALAAAAIRGRRSVLHLDALPSGHDLDPYRDAEYGINEIAWLFGDGLVGWSNGPVPLLAEALPEMTDGGRRYRYRLRRTRWHDGQPVRSADVVRAFEAIRGGFWGTFQPYRGVREVVTAGDRAFDVVLRRPYAGFVRSFFGPYGKATLPVLRSADASIPIGTGPFAVRERIDLNRWRLESVGDSPRGRARVDGIDLRFLYSRQTEFVSLLSGETDIALPIPGRFPASPSFRRIRRTTGTTLLIFNLAGPFGDFRTRRALAKTLDVPALQRGYDPRRTSLLASFRLDGPNDERLTRLLARDLSFAEELRHRLAGHEVRIITLPGTTVDVAMGLVRQTLVSKTGVAVQMVATPYNGLFGPTSPLRRGTFDLAVNSYTYADEADLAADWSCASRAPSGGNFANLCDRALDRAIASGDREASFRRLYDGLAAIPLSRSYEDIGVARRVCDFTVPSSLVPATYSCAAWRLC